MEEMNYTCEFDVNEKPHYGGEIKYYNVSGEESVSLGKGCYLSDNFVMLPFHAITEDIEENDIILQDCHADFAIIRVNERAKTLIPIISPVVLKLNMDGNTIKEEPQPLEGFEFLMTAVFTSNLDQGDSGSLIYGRGNCTFGFNREQKEACVPLYMVIARKCNDHETGMLISLPHLLGYGLKKLNFPDTIPLKEITEDILDGWELITTFGQVQREVNAQAENSFPSKSKRDDKLNSRKSEGVDSVFIDALMTKTGIRAKALQNAFLVAEPLGEVGTPENDKCWVVVTEREFSDGSSKYFKKVSNMMKEKSILNIDCSDQDRVILYPNTGRRITVNQRSYEYFRSVQGKKHSSCHHPMLCELNSYNKGVGEKLTHCCIRPSHLVLLNQGFNNFCACVLQGMGKNPGAGKIEVEWS